MSDLFDKLNTLLRSSLDSLVHGLPGVGSGQDNADMQFDPAALRDPRAIAEVERKASAMRKQIEAALSEEDAMQDRLNETLQLVEVFDQQADAALERGDEQEARKLVGQMQQQRHRASMLSAQLDEHREATSAYIERVNLLEAMVVDARRMLEALGENTEVTQTAAPDTAQTSAQSRAEIIPPALAGQLDQLGKATTAKLSDLLQTVRERAETVLAPIITKVDEPNASASASTETSSGAATTPTVPPKPADQGRDQNVDDDLARRRERLSKPE